MKSRTDRLSLPAACAYADHARIYLMVKDRGDIRVELDRDDSGRRVARVIHVPTGEHAETQIDPSAPLLPQVSALVSSMPPPSS